VDIVILALIVANVLALILESVASIYGAYRLWFRSLEVVSVAVFSVEYLLRAWSSVEDRRFAGAGGRLRYMASPLAIVDLLAVLPFWLPMIGGDLRILRTLRLFRIFWLGKLGRYSDALQTLGRVVAAKRAELAITGALGAALLLIASSLMYFAENAAQPEVFSSIPASMWWAVATLTTVGYGDVYPITPVGRVLGSVIAVLGIGMFALPTGILGAAFTEELQAHRASVPGRCSRCGK
jgi:voltage-gated potassium channel